MSFYYRRQGCQKRPEAHKDVRKTQAHVVKKKQKNTVVLKVGSVQRDVVNSMALKCIISCLPAPDTKQPFLYKKMRCIVDIANELLNIFNLINRMCCLWISFGKESEKKDPYSHSYHTHYCTICSAFIESLWSFAKYTLPNMQFKLGLSYKGTLQWVINMNT